MSYDIAIWTAAGFGIAALITALWLDDRRDRLASASLRDPLTSGNTIRESRNRRSAAWSVMALLVQSQIPGLNRRVRTGASAQAGPGADNGQSPPSPGSVPRSRAQAAGTPGSAGASARGPGHPRSWADDLAGAGPEIWARKGEPVVVLTACPNCGRPGFDGTLCGRCGWGYGYQPAYEAQVAAVYPPGVLPVTRNGGWQAPPRSGPWVPVRDGARVPCADTAWDREQAAWLRELLAMSREGYASLGEFAASRRPS